MKTWLICVVLLVAVLVLPGCSAMSQLMASSIGQPELPVTGDPLRGEALFRAGLEGAPPCSACHQAVEDGAGFSLGPNLSGIAARAAGRIAGMSAEQYLENSILDPESYILAGYHVSMFTDYAAYLSQQDLADLVAYLMTL